MAPSTIRDQPQTAKAPQSGADPLNKILIKWGKNIYQIDSKNPLAEEQEWCQTVLFEQSDTPEEPVVMALKDSPARVAATAAKEEMAPRHWHRANVSLLVSSISVPLGAMYLPAVPSTSVAS